MTSNSRQTRAYLDLVRLPNVFTAVADALAGFLYVGGTVEDWPTLVALAGASSCLYVGGVVLNDVCDAKRDMRERPQRPIPSNRVSRPAASVLAVALLGTGVACAACVAIESLVIAGLLALAIVLYDVVLKQTRLAPAVMGSCRALNLALAMSWVVSGWTAAMLIPIGLMWIYITCLTFFARYEAGASTPGRLAGGVAGMCLAVVGLSSLYWILEPARPAFLGIVAGMFLFVGHSGWLAITEPEPAKVQHAVKKFVLSIVIFDTCLTAAARGPLIALAVAAMLLPAWLLSRLFRVT